jgi:hypothetical protein
VNGLRFCARLARLQTGRTLAATCRNVLPLFTGGQVVQRLPNRCPPIRSIWYQDARGAMVAASLSPSAIAELEAAKKE